MQSSEFRKRFASLTERTVVTVHGHVIGRWLPGPDPDPETLLPRFLDRLADDSDRIKNAPLPSGSGETPTDRVRASVVEPRNPYAEFRPAPKPTLRHR